MSRSRSSNSVSLFPFLAVLVCAMGALIFLLIVTTQRIRSEAVERAMVERREKKAQAEQNPQDVVTPALPVYVPPPITPADRWLAESDGPKKPERIEPIPGLVELGSPRSTPVLPPSQVIPPPLPAPEPEPIWPAAIAEKPAPRDPNIPLRADYVELQKARQTWLDAVQKKEQTIARLKQELDSLTESLGKVNSQIEEVAKDRIANREAQRELLASRNTLLGQLAKVEQQIEDSKNQSVGSPTKFQVVPFDGLTGTNYRPIIIECTAAGMRFLPEDVLVTESDFDGFTLGKNPLLAGAKALSEYWTQVSGRSQGKEPAPYVLLIVRPSGAKYYAARQLLEALDRPFGYELVEENLPLDIPPKDPIAAELCRNAVAETLKERDDLKRLITSHGPEILNRNPNYRVTRKPGGGFDVEYAPNGKFAGDGAGGNPNSPLFGGRDNSPFGQSPERDLNTPGSVDGYGERSRIGVPPAPTETPLPASPRDKNQDPGSPGIASMQNPSREPAGSGTNPGGENDDPRRPRLLPEEIIRRSQGHLPYREGDGSPMDSQLSRAPSNERTQEPGIGASELGESGNTKEMIAPGTTRGNPNPSRLDTGGMPNRSELPNTSGQSTSPSIDTNPSRNVQELNSGSQSNSGQSPPQGTPGTGSGSPTPPGTPSTGYEPAMPNFSRLNSRRMLNQMEPYQRRWGLSDPRASIGFEREITVRVEPARLVVGNAFSVTYDARTTKEELGVGLLEAIELTVRKWGRPPISFYWVPTIKFQVGNNEVPVYRHLTATAKAWGLETSAEGIEN